jgi:hypothetical protein
MPCDNLAVQTARLEASVFSELRASEAMQKVVSDLLVRLTRTRLTPYVYVYDRAAYFEVAGVTVTVNQDGTVSSRAGFQSTADAVTKELQATLPELAKLYATQRTLAAIEKAAKSSKTERLGANAYRVRARIAY